MYDYEVIEVGNGIPLAVAILVCAATVAGLCFVLDWVLDRVVRFLNRGQSYKIQLSQGSRAWLTRKLKGVEHLPR